MPIKDEKERRDYMRDYHAEFRLGLRRSEAPAVVVEKMDERRADREEYLRQWAAANKERRTAARREQRRQERLRALEGLLGKVNFK
jgi:hypothetical protein